MAKPYPVQAASGPRGGRHCPPVAMTVGKQLIEKGKGLMEHEARASLDSKVNGAKNSASNGDGNDQARARGRVGAFGESSRGDFASPINRSSCTDGDILASAYTETSVQGEGALSSKDEKLVCSKETFEETSQHTYTESTAQTEGALGETTAPPGQDPARKKRE